jgi:hypothetical protein
VIAHKPQPPKHDLKSPFQASLFRIRPETLAAITGTSSINERYEEEMEQFLILRDWLKPVSFIVENSGTVLATDVRVHITFPKSEGVQIVPWQLGPEKPEYRQSVWSHALRNFHQDPDVWVTEEGE